MTCQGPSCRWQLRNAGRCRGCASVEPSAPAGAGGGANVQAKLVGRRDAVAGELRCSAVWWAQHRIAQWRRKREGRLFAATCSTFQIGPS